MKISDGFKNKRLTYKFLMSYFIILFIPLFLGLLSYEISQNAVAESVKDKNLQLLKQTMNIMDSRLKEVENIAEQALINPEVRSFQYIKDPLDKGGPIKINQVRNSLLRLKLTNKFVYSYYIIFKQANIAISPELVEKLPGFYGSVVEYTGMSYDDWYEKVVEEFHWGDYWPAADINLRNLEDRDNIQSMVTFLLSSGYQKHSNAVVMLFVDNNEIRSLLKGINISEGGFVYIADGKGGIISSVSHDEKLFDPIESQIPDGTGATERKLGGERMLLTYTISPENGWKYVAAQPVSFVMERVESIKNITLAITFFSLFAGIAISVILSYRNAGPVSRLLELVKNPLNSENKKKADAFEIIENTLSKLIMDNDGLRSSLSEQKPLIKNVFIDRLLKGELQSEKEIQYLMNHLDMRFEGTRHAVVILHISGYDLMVNGDILEELDKKRVVINEVLKKYERYIHTVHNLEQDKIVLIISFESEDADLNEKSMEETVLRIENELKDTYNINTEMAMGELCINIADISRSFDQARQVLYYRSISLEGCETRFRNLPKDTSAYFYPVEIEISLINNIKSGNEGKALAILNELFEENFTARKLSISMIRGFLYDMQGTVIKLAEQVILEDNRGLEILNRIKGMNEKDHVDIMKSAFGDTFSIICGHINERKKSHNIQLIKNIKELIDTAYMKPELSLTMIACRFGLSEVYASHFFKEQTGENFFSYVENIRMEKACELLKASEFNINSISELAGYSSSYSFSRAFKRKLGMSPSEYRDIGR